MDGPFDQAATFVGVVACHGLRGFGMPSVIGTSIKTTIICFSFHHLGLRICFPYCVAALLVFDLRCCALFFLSDCPQIEMFHLESALMCFLYDVRCKVCLSFWRSCVSFVVSFQFLFSPSCKANQCYGFDQSNTSTYWHSAVSVQGFHFNTPCRQIILHF